MLVDRKKSNQQQSTPDTTSTPSLARFRPNPTHTHTYTHASTPLAEVTTNACRSAQHTRHRVWALRQSNAHAPRVRLPWFTWSQRAGALWPAIYHHVAPNPAPRKYPAPVVVSQRPLTACTVQRPASSVQLHVIPPRCGSRMTVGSATLSGAARTGHRFFSFRAFYTPDYSYVQYYTISFT